MHQNFSFRENVLEKYYIPHMVYMYGANYVLLAAAQYLIRKIISPGKKVGRRPKLLYMYCILYLHVYTGRPAVL